MWVVDNFNDLLKKIYKKSMQEQMVFKPNYSISPLYTYTSLPNDFLIEKAFIGSKRILFPFIQMKQNSSIVPETTLHFSL